MAHSSLEWLALELPLTAQVVDCSTLGIAARTATLRRSEDGLMLMLEAEGPGRGPTRDGHATGLPVPPSEVVLQQPSGERMTLSGVAPTLWNVEGVREPREGNAIIPVGRVRSYVNLVDSASGTGTPNRIVEWVAHAPKWCIWPRATEWEDTDEAYRVRDGERVRIGERGRKSASWDHLLVDLGHPNLRAVRFGKVDEEHLSPGDPVPSPGFIEYLPGVRGLPDDKLRASVREGLGFLFGSGVNVVGRTYFDANHQVVAYRLVSSAASRKDREQPPAILDTEEGSTQLVSEPLIAAFLRAYLDAEAFIDLGRVTWLLRHSLDATIDMAAGYSGAAFEVLRKGYYKHPSRRARTIVLPKADWKLIESDLVSRLEKAEGLSTEDLRTFTQGIRRLNQRSGTRLNAQFLQDLGLPIGDAELAALASRNDAAHGNEMDDDQLDYWSAAADALWTLTSRAVFAALDVEVPGYIDYGSSGADRFPVRRLREPQELRTRRRLPAHGPG